MWKNLSQHNHHKENDQQPQNRTELQLQDRTTGNLPELPVPRFGISCVSNVASQSFCRTNGVEKIARWSVKGQCYKHLGGNSFQGGSKNWRISIYNLYKAVSSRPKRSFEIYFVSHSENIDMKCSWMIASKVIVRGYLNLNPYTLT